MAYASGKLPTLSPILFHPNKPTQNLIKTPSLLLLGLATTLLASCVAGTVDRVEDRYDRREDRVDRHTYSGPGDHLESRIDRRENLNDKARGRRGL